MYSDYFFFSTLIAVIINCCNSLVLLSDVPTPSFIIDVQALRRSLVAEPLTIMNNNDEEEVIPAIRCPKNNLILHPISITDNSNNNDDDEQYSNNNFKKNRVVVDCNFPIIEGQPAIGYLHSTVTRGRDDAIVEQDGPLSTFLAEIDLDTALCGGGSGAHLVLGLNNHHVGSYYWARSAGAGSSMEAPGVWYGRSYSSNSNSNNNNKDIIMGGVLRWLDDNGPTACNSNDGKRSEWVNFLRKGDTVQLLPSDGQDAILEFHNRYGDGVESRIFGISSEGRPMGSEPRVVCEWRCTYGE